MLPVAILYVPFAMCYGICAMLPVAMVTAAIVPIAGTHIMWLHVLCYLLLSYTYLFLCNSVFLCLLLYIAMVSTVMITADTDVLL